MRPHVLTYPDVDGKEYSHARYRYLLQIIFGETIAIDYCSKMASFSSNEESARFLLKQQAEENTHLDLLTGYVVEHSRGDAQVSPFLKKLDKIMSGAINEKDYVACIFIQNFIVEGLNVSLLKEFEHHTDGILSELSTKILKDEVNHAKFGIDEIKRILKENKSANLRKKLISLQRKTLFYATGLAADLAREAKNLGIPMREFSEKTVSEHFDRINEVGLSLPVIDKFLFKFAKYFLKLI